MTVKSTPSAMSTVAMTTVAMTTDRTGTTTTGFMTKPETSNTTVIIVAIVCGSLVLVLLGIALIVLACRTGRRRGLPVQSPQDVESASTPSTDSGHVSRPATPGTDPGGAELIPRSDLPGGKARRDVPAPPPTGSSRDETEWIPFAQLEAARENEDATTPPPSDSPDEEADIYSVIPGRQAPTDDNDELYITPPAEQDDDDNLYDIPPNDNDNDDSLYVTPPYDQDENDNLYDIPPTDNDSDDSLYVTPPNDVDEDYYSTIGESKLTKSKPQDDQAPPEDTIDQMYAKVDKSRKTRQTHHGELEGKERRPEDTSHHYFTLEEATELKKETTVADKEKRRPVTWPMESSQGRARNQGE
uniref:Uncharacterized protein n=1 Tax=Branchiostoma floridae TaxID=7739 RepID=C3ZFL5_BRAFL|eukprot:XP_002592612.1 hypothetical protein BRAFLDRAFT_104582 [Branchiostoma floridae]